MTGRGNSTGVRRASDGRSFPESQAGLLAPPDAALQPGRMSPPASPLPTRPPRTAECQRMSPAGTLSGNVPGMLKDGRLFSGRGASRLDLRRPVRGCGRRRQYRCLAGQPPDHAVHRRRRDHRAGRCLDAPAPDGSWRFSAADRSCQRRLPRVFRILLPRGPDWTGVLVRFSSSSLRHRARRAGSSVPAEIAA